jgi:hypothetical protein
LLFYINGLPNRLFSSPWAFSTFPSFPIVLTTTSFIALLRPFVGSEDRVQGEAVLLDDIKDFSGNTGLSFFIAQKAKNLTSEKGRKGQTR